MGLADHTIAALRPLRFRGKNRLLGWLLPYKGIRKARVRRGQTRERFMIHCFDKALSTAAARHHPFRPR